MDFWEELWTKFRRVKQRRGKEESENEKKNMISEHYD
jgi:hypothetical protein